MRTFKTLIVGITASIVLFSAPHARAQSIDDLELMQTFLAIMTDYFEIIEATHQVASDPERSAIMQMQKIQEVYEERGNKAQSVAVLEKVLNDSNNQTIRNAAYMLLGDTLKEVGRADDALDYLQRGLDENIRAAE